MYQPVNGGNKDRMIGRHCPDGPGGVGCPCCQQAPGNPRKFAKRNFKRRERQVWKSEVTKILREG